MGVPFNPGTASVGEATFPSALPSRKSISVTLAASCSSEMPEVSYGSARGAMA